MKVKVGDTTYLSSDYPIMVILTPQDRKNIFGMQPQYTKYAEFEDNCPMTKYQKLQWMDDECLYTCTRTAPPKDNKHPFSTLDDILGAVEVRLEQHEPGISLLTKRIVLDIVKEVIDLVPEREDDS